MSFFDLAWNFLKISAWWHSRELKKIPVLLVVVISDWIWSGQVGSWCSYNVSLIVIKTMIFKAITKKFKVLIWILPYLEVFVSRISHWVSQSVNDCPTYRTPPLALTKGKAKKKMLPTSDWSGPPAGQTYKNCPHFIDL